MYYIASNLERSYYISHHGIKGQKWGVRRFQNLDRTWTAAGKERYGSGKDVKYGIREFRKNSSGNHSARAYKRQLNKVDKQMAKQIYKREKKNDTLKRIDAKIEKRTERGKNVSQRLLKRQEKYSSLVQKYDTQVKRGEEITKRTIASATKAGYRVSSKNIVRVVSGAYGMVGTKVNPNRKYSGLVKGHLLANSTLSNLRYRKMLRGASKESVGFVNGKTYKVKRQK